MLASLMIPVMNVALVLGVAFVMPLSLRTRWEPWAFASTLVAVALALSPGWLAALLIAPWVLLAALHVWRALAEQTPVHFIAGGFALTAALALTFSRAGATLFQIPEPIVQLTALHFTYAGTGTFMLATRLDDQHSSRLTRAALGLALLAPPVVALGFIFRSAAGQLGGATLMTAGAWLVAALQLTRLRAFGNPSWTLLLISSLSPWVAMVLAVTWAAQQYFPSVPALGVPEMVPTHGALNAFGFVLCGHLAWWLRDRWSAPPSAS